VRLSRLLTGGAVVAVLTGTAACGLQSLEPKLELRNAAGDFAAAHAGAVRLSLAGSAAQFRAFAAEGDKEDRSSGSTTIPDADLKRLLSSSILIGYDGGNAKDTTDDAARIDIRVGGLDAGEIRVARQVLYARVDVPGLVQQFPEIKDGVDSANASLTGPDGDTSPVEALRAPAEALLAGKWVSLDAGPDSWLGKQLRSATGAKSSGTASSALAPDAPAKLKAIFGKAFANGVTVKRLGSDDRLGDHLEATASLRTVYKNIRGDLAGLFSGSAAADLGGKLPQVGDVPDRQLGVSFWVADGKLTRVELNLAQFLDRPTGALVLRADNLPAEKIAAPSGAVRIDPQAIADQTGMSLQNLLGSGGAPATDARTIAGYVDEDIRSLAGEDGVAPSVGYLTQAAQDMEGLAEGVEITRVGSRVQVSVGGDSACLALPRTAEGTGTVTDGPCA
jgi:hypothetical protein